jgi:hypothetical protein
MKEIKLTQNQTALVDDEDYNKVKVIKWFAVKCKNTYYAKGHLYSKGEDKTICLHRIIMNTPDDMEVDHKDHNGLNCQKNNLRNCTHRQNGMNGTSRGKSKYLGVYLMKGETYKNKTYRDTIAAKIGVKGKNIYLGAFKTEEAAALAYDEAAKIHYGEFANLNFK